MISSRVQGNGCSDPQGALKFTLQRGPYHGQGTRSIYTPAPVNLWLKNALSGDINPWALLVLCTYRKSLSCSLCAALQQSNAGADWCVWKPQEDGMPRTTSKGIDLVIHRSFPGSLGCRQGPGCWVESRGPRPPGCSPAVRTDWVTAERPHTPLRVRGGVMLRGSL